MRQYTMETPVGLVALTAEGGKLTGIRFVEERGTAPCPGGVLTEAVRQLDEYFSGSRKVFDLPLKPPRATTAFQQKVLAALARVGYGERVTYGELARRVGTSARAIGGAMHRNPLPIVWPCHRVVAAHGLGGYSGDWERGRAITVKERLLALEAENGPPCP